MNLNDYRYGGPLYISVNTRPISFPIGGPGSYDYERRRLGEVGPAGQEAPEEEVRDEGGRSGIATPGPFAPEEKTPISRSGRRRSDTAVERGAIPRSGT